MANKFTDYDMRKFKITDTADIYAFFRAIEKGIAQSEVIIKKLNMSNAAQAGVIRSLERRAKGPVISVAEEAEGYATIIQSLETGTVDSTKDLLINKLRAAQGAPEEEVEVVEEPVVESGEEGEVGPVGEEGPTDDVTAEDKDEVTYRGYAKRRFKNGQTRYLIDGGTMVKQADVPEEIKAKLDELLG